MKVMKADARAFVSTRVNSNCDGIEFRTVCRWRGRPAQLMLRGYRRSANKCVMEIAGRESRTRNRARSGNQRNPPTRNTLNRATLGDFSNSPGQGTTGHGHAGNVEPPSLMHD